MPPVTLDPKAKILALLEENHVMTVATVRPDGWPQATVVGYVHDDLTLYFAVARMSQKLANIALEPRVSLALGHDTEDRIRGLSMAAHAVEVTDLAEVERLNALMRDRYAGRSRLWPREASSAILRARPTVVSIIDLAKGPGEPELVEVAAAVTVHHIHNTSIDRGNDSRIRVNFVHPNPSAYRPGAPL
jgi:nitroimidazol reductase NimA-like FMN-containing flavoprotein (pyridoxamine 5'-phosphate oxidase superfamily)